VIPEALDPDRFFGAVKNSAEAERPLLEAVAGEFGVRLPRHAIVRGRLHTFTTRPWTRPPGEGEGYMVISVQPLASGPTDSERRQADGPVTE
jgi:hypothetical protein